MHSSNSSDFSTVKVLCYTVLIIPSYIQHWHVTQGVTCFSGSVTDSNHTLAFVRKFAGYLHYKVVMAKSLASMLFAPFKSAFCKFQQCIHSNAAPRPKHTTTETYHVSSAVYQPSATSNETLVHIVCSH